MPNLTLLLFFIFTFTTCFGQTDSDTLEPVILLRYGSGLPDLPARERVAVNYHIKLQTVGDCHVGQSFVDSIAQLNKPAYEKLDQINGPNWRKNFEKDVKVAYQQDSLMNEQRKIP
ncbi:MAG: hypothetical protein AB7G44_08755 [Bacteroidia bacterium]